MHFHSSFSLKQLHQKQQLQEQFFTKAEDFIIANHFLEHAQDPIRTIKRHLEVLKPGGVLFLYLPHPDMEYWLPQNCRKHLHSWSPGQVRRILIDLGFWDVLASERDLAWSFSVVGFNGSHRPGMSA